MIILIMKLLSGPTFPILVVIIYAKLFLYVKCVYVYVYHPPPPKKKIGLHPFLIR